MADDARLRSVVALAQGTAAARGLLGAAHAAAAGMRAALGGSFAAVSVWERERGRLRVLVNNGELAADEEEFPADESYSLHDFPEVTGLPPDRGDAPAAAGGDGAPAGAPPSGSAGDEALAWVATSDGSGARPAALRARGRGSCVVAPVLLHGRVWGELYVARGPRAESFGPADAEFAAVLASVVAAGLVQLERLEEVRRLAFTDPLTGLANRRAVDARLDEAVAEHRRSGARVGLIVCDINGLKAVNDSLGHTAGDRLLERFGSVLSLCGAHLPEALAARLGGDEFCLVVSGQPADEVVRTAEDICRRAAGLELGDGVACGVAVTDGGSGGGIDAVDSARRLFRLADAAQYRAKAAAAKEPVVAGSEGPHDPVVRLADAAPDSSADRSTETARSGERRAFRGRHSPGPEP